MTQRKLGKNQLACLQALDGLPANQSPNQVWERMRSLDREIESHATSIALASILKKGYARRTGIRGAYYYTITELGKTARKEAQAVEEAIATIKSSGQGDRIPF